jgi:hypothetical protein
MPVEVLDQLEVARRGGVCARYPTSCVVRDLLARSGLLKPLQPLRVLDVTYGQGIWWMTLPQARVYGIDVKKLEWKRRPACFLQAPAWAWRSHAGEVEECLRGRPGLIAVDPPWQECVRGNGCQGREIGGRYHYRVSAAVGSPEHILEAATEAARHYRAPLLVHYETRWVPEGFRVVVETWWKPFLPNVDKYGYRNWWGILAPAPEG